MPSISCNPMSKQYFSLLGSAIFLVLVVTSVLYIRLLGHTEVGWLGVWLFLFASLCPACILAMVYPIKVKIHSLFGILLILPFAIGSTVFGLIPFTLLFMNDAPNDYSFLEFYIRQFGTAFWYGIFFLIFLIALWMVRVVFPSIPPIKKHS